MTQLPPTIFLSRSLCPRHAGSPPFVRFLSLVCVCFGFDAETRPSSTSHLLLPHMMQSHTCSCCPRLWPLVKAVEDLQSLMDGVKRAAGVIWRFYLCVGAYLFPCQQILETPWLKSSELFCVLVTEALDLCGFVDYPCRTEALDLPQSLSSV